MVPLLAVATLLLGVFPTLAGAGTAGVDYAFLGLDWQDDPPQNVPYWVHTEVIAQPGYLAAIQAAFQVWESDPGSNVSFVYQGPTNVESEIALQSNGTYSNPSDGMNVVSFQPLGFTPQGQPVLGRGGLAVSQTFVNGQWISSNQMDVSIANSHAQHLAIGAVPNKADLQMVAAHEIGHALGLAHPSRGDQLMSAILPNGTTARRGLEAGDQEGIAILYPAPAVFGPTCNGEAVTINMNTGARGVGTAAKDVILGTDGADRIFGLAGNDVICGEGGVDRIFGGDGDDWLSGGGSSDRIKGNAGDDTLYGGSGADRMWGGAGTDTLFGGGGQDRMLGEAGDDTMQGNHSSDDMWGGDGNDILRGSKGKDEMWGDNGNDQLFGGVNSDTLVGGSGTDLLDGQQGADTCQDGAGTTYRSC